VAAVKQVTVPSHNDARAKKLVVPMAYDGKRCEKPKRGDRGRQHGPAKDDGKFGHGPSDPRRVDQSTAQS